MRKKIRINTDYISFFVNYALGREVLPYKPFFLMIEPTNMCNLKCIMCPQSGKLTRKRGFMEFSLFEKVITEAKDFIHTLQLFHSGEPLLHRELSQMIKMATDFGIFSIINTNASLLTSEVAEKLIGAGLDLISISFDGFDKKTYEEIRVGAVFEKTLENIGSIVRLKKQMKVQNPRIVMEIIDMERTRSVIPRYKEQALNIGAEEVRVWKYQNWTEPDMSRNTRRSNRFYPCEYPYTILAVLWDGTVVPCCMDYNAKYVLGNVGEESLIEIWNNSREQILRKVLRERREGEISLCRNCSFLWESKSYCTTYGKVFAHFSRVIGHFRKTRDTEKKS